MCSTHVLWLNKLLSSVLFIVMFTVVLAACGTRSNGTVIGSAPTLSSIPTFSTVPGYGKPYGCPSDVVVSTAQQAPDVTVELKQESTIIKVHRGDLVEIQLPFGVAWIGPTPSHDILELLSPSGYVWTLSNACIWRFVAMSTGPVVLDFSGRDICQKVSLCVPSVVEVTFTITVD